MGRKRNQTKGKPDWVRAKRLCRLNQEDIRMAKELGMAPRSLIKNRPTPQQQWKAPVKWWIRDLYAKKFPDRVKDGLFWLEDDETPSKRPSDADLDVLLNLDGELEFDAWDEPDVGEIIGDEIPERHTGYARPHRQSAQSSREQIPAWSTEDPEPWDPADWHAYAEQEDALAGIDGPTRAKVIQEWQYPLRSYHDYREAALAVAAAWAEIEAVERVVLFGSVAKPLPRIKPRSRILKQARLMTWHRCSDVDLAVWLSDLTELRRLQKTRSQALNRLLEERDIGVAHHQIDTFIMEPVTDRYLGRLCHFRSCPKEKPECWVDGCGEVSLLRVIEDFVLKPQALSAEHSMVLWERGTGNVCQDSDLFWWP